DRENFAVKAACIVLAARLRPSCVPRFPSAPTEGDGAPGGAPPESALARRGARLAIGALASRRSIAALGGAFSGSASAPGPGFLGRGRLRPVPVQQAPCSGCACSFWVR